MSSARDAHCSIAWSKGSVLDMARGFSTSVQNMSMSLFALVKLHLHVTEIAFLDAGPTHVSTCCWQAACPVLQMLTAM